MKFNTYLTTVFAVLALASASATHVETNDAASEVFKKAIRNKLAEDPFCNCGPLRRNGPKLYEDCASDSQCEWKGEVPHCQCNAEQDSRCRCSFRADYDSCRGEKVCKWAGEIPDCHCSAEQDSTCRCSFRSNDYDSCVGQKVCEWTGKLPKCGCKPGNADCNCSIRSNDKDSCRGEEVCEWNECVPKFNFFAEIRPGVCDFDNYDDCVSATFPASACEWKGAKPKCGCREGNEGCHCEFRTFESCLSENICEWNNNLRLTESQFDLYWRRATKDQLIAYMAKYGTKSTNGEDGHGGDSWVCGDIACYWQPQFAAAATRRPEVACPNYFFSGGGAVILQLNLQK